MVKTLNLNTEIPPNRELRIALPADVPIGPAEIVLVVTPVADSPTGTPADLAASEFFGIWRDRPDIVDSFQFARKLRDEGWKRPA